MSPDDLAKLHEKIDALTNAFHESAEQRAVLATEVESTCTALKELTIAVMGDTGIRARLTKAEGKIGVGQWLVLTFGGALITCLVGGIWAIAVRI